MTIKEKIKELIGAEKFTAIEKLLKEQKFAEVKTKDGNTLKYEGDLKEGVAVFIVTPQGDVPAPDGVIELEDGSSIEVAAGVVTKVNAAGEMPAPVAQEDVANEKMAADITTIVEKLTAMQAEIDELKSKFSAKQDEDNFNKKVSEAVKNAIGNKFSDIENTIKDVAHIVAEISNLPIAEPKEKQFAAAKTSREEKIQNLAKKLQTT